jgi:hypothetical protein
MSSSNSGPNPFVMNMGLSNVAGSITRANPLDLSLPACMRTTSPQKSINQVTTLRSTNNTKTTMQSN